VVEKRLELKTAIALEKKKLVEYEQVLLKRLDRFNKVKGPLYDPVTGWNPGYRIL